MEKKELFGGAHNEYKTLDEIWDDNNREPGFFVVVKNDVFQSKRKVTGKTFNSPIYADGLFWVGGRLICKKDCQKSIWKQVKN